MRGALVLAAALGSSCVTPPRMCASEGDCGAQASCVSGRCVPHGATAAIASARRLVAGAVEVGWVRRGAAAGADTAILGRDDARLFLRFALPLTSEAEVLEAYLLLDRAPAVDADPAPLALHAERVTSPWDARSLSWAEEPAFEPMGAPVTRVAPGTMSTVRLDVRLLVERWMKRRGDDYGLAVVAEGQSASGIAFALVPQDAPIDRGEPRPSTPAASAAPGLERAEAPPSPRQAEGPRIEVYLK